MNFSVDDDDSILWKLSGVVLFTLLTVHFKSNLLKAVIMALNICYVQEKEENSYMKKQDERSQTVTQAAQLYMMRKSQ